MLISSLLKKALEVNIHQFIYYNFFCKNVVRQKNARLIPYRGTHIHLDKTSKLYLNADLRLNGMKMRGSKQECLVTLREGATLKITGNTYFYYGTTLQVHKDAECLIGESRFNTGSTIICAYKMTIGDGVSTARGVFIFDSDHHPVFNAEGNRINEAKEVVIGNNVWIGLKATIMKGTHIEDGSVISAHSLVSGNIPGHTMIATAPARPVMKDISWHR